MSGREMLVTHDRSLASSMTETITSAINDCNLQNTRTVNCEYVVYTFVRRKATAEVAVFDSDPDEWWIFVRPLNRLAVWNGSSRLAKEIANVINNRREN